MKPLKDKVLIEPFNEAKLKHTDILLPDYAENVLPFRGKVLAVGEKIKDIKAGDTVLFDRLRAGSELNNNGIRFKLNNQDLLCIPERLVLAIIE